MAPFLNSCRPPDRWGLEKALLGPVVPMLVVLLAYLIVYRGDLEAFFGTNFFIWFAAAGVLDQVWNLWVLIDIIRKRDPVYDKIAGTAVLRSSTRPRTGEGLPI
jgi:hypothetical protein